MAVTSPDSLRTPNPGDPYNLVADLAILAQDTQDALTRRANVFNGTIAQRTAFTSTATDGMLWQDTDGIKMIWRKDSAAWVPAVWRWSGSTAQMNAFAAPNGFEWFSTTDNAGYVRIGGSWKKTTEGFRVSLTPTVTGGGQTSGWYYAADTTYTFPAGTFTAPPQVSLYASGPGFLVTHLRDVTSTGFIYGVARLGVVPDPTTRVLLQAWAQ